MIQGKIAITTIGIFVIGFIYWFFFGEKEKKTAQGENIDILVDGGYKPSVIQMKKDKPTTLNFLRKDPNTCLEEVYFPDYKIKKYLPLNEKVSIVLSPPHHSESGFHCSMNMFRGEVKIV